MKSWKPTAAVLATALMLGACASGERGIYQSSLRFDYKTAYQEGSGVIRAFDDGSRTIIQFVDLAKADPAIRDDHGNPLTYDAQGQYAVLTGLYEHITVSTSGNRVPVTIDSTRPLARTESIAAEPAASSPAGGGVVTTAEELARANAALDKAEKELAAVKIELAAARTLADHRRINKQLDALESRVADSATVILRVEFEYANRSFKPASALAQALLSAARSAAGVFITGHTDATGDTVANERLGMARALSARAYLIQQGVAGSKIRVFSKGAVEQVSENTSEEGRAKNRRVDIEFLNAQALAARKMKEQQHIASEHTSKRM